MRHLFLMNKIDETLTTVKDLHGNVHFMRSKNAAKVDDNLQMILNNLNTAVEQLNTVNKLLMEES